MAAQFWDLPDVWDKAQEDTIHISRPLGEAVIRRSGVTGHRTKLFDGGIVCVDGIYLTTRERTWLDLAEALSVDNLVVLADYLVRIPHPAAGAGRLPSSMTGNASAARARWLMTSAGQRLERRRRPAHVGGLALASAVSSGPTAQDKRPGEE